MTDVSPAIETPSEEKETYQEPIENIVVDVKVESMIPPEDDVDMVNAQDEIEVQLQLSVDNEAYQSMIQDDKQSIFKRTQMTPVDTVGSKSFANIDDTSSHSKPDVKDAALNEIVSTIRLRDRQNRYDRHQPSSPPVPKVIELRSPKQSKTDVQATPTGAPCEKPAESKPKIYLREDIQLKSKELIQEDAKNAKMSDCVKCKPTKIKCIHCNMIMDVQMDCILYHCLSCETIVKDDDDASSRESKYLCFACKVYVFDNTCGRTHIKKHISTHLKRMNLYEPGNTWY